MVKTFMEWLKLKEVDDPMQLRTVLGSLVGANPANSLPVIATNLAKKDRGLAVAIANDPATKAAETVADAQKRRTNPSQANQNPYSISPNVVGAMSNTNI